MSIIYRKKIKINFEQQAHSQVYLFKHKLTTKILKKLILLDFQCALLFISFILIMFMLESLKKIKRQFLISNFLFNLKKSKNSSHTDISKFRFIAKTTLSCCLFENMLILDMVILLFDFMSHFSHPFIHLK